MVGWLVAQKVALLVPRLVDVMVVWMVALMADW